MHYFIRLNLSLYCSFTLRRNECFTADSDFLQVQGLTVRSIVLYSVDRPSNKGWSMSTRSSISLDLSQSVELTVLESEE